MKDLKNKEGQALIETAIVLVLLLILLIGIAEFSSAWYRKNSLKNAVRSGARLAAVTCGITKTSGSCTDWSDSACRSRPATVAADCNDITDSTNNTAIIATVCCSPGVPKDAADNTTVTVDFPNRYPPDGLTADDVKVSASTMFNFVIGGGIWPWPPSTKITTDATMRHE